MAVQAKTKKISIRVASIEDVDPRNPLSTVFAVYGFTLLDLKAVGDFLAHVLAYTRIVVVQTGERYRLVGGVFAYSIARAAICQGLLEKSFRLDAIVIKEEEGDSYEEEVAKCIIADCIASVGLFAALRPKAALTATIRELSETLEAYLPETLNTNTRVSKLLRTSRSRMHTWHKDFTANLSSESKRHESKSETPPPPTPFDEEAKIYAEHQRKRQNRNPQTTHRRRKRRRKV